MKSKYIKFKQQDYNRKKLTYLNYLKILILNKKIKAQTK